MSPCGKRVELGLKVELDERATNGLGIMIQTSGSGKRICSRVERRQRLTLL